MNESGLCRVCADLSDNTSPLFKGTLRILLPKIKNITGLRMIRIQELPQNICKRCENEILQAHNFRDRCIRAQEGFKTLCTQKAEKHSLRKKKRKNKPPDDAPRMILDDAAIVKDEAPPIEEIIFEETNGYKVEKEIVNAGEMLLKQESSDEDRNSNESSCIRVADDYSAKEDYMLAIEPGKSLVIAENPLSHRKDMNNLREDTVVTEPETQNRKHISLPSKNDLKPHKKTTPTSNRKHTSSLLTQKKKKPKSNEKEKILLTLLPKSDEKRDYRAEHTWICDLCGKHFTVKNNFKMHMLRHSNIKPFPCKLCPKGYYSNSDLIRHSLRHTGVKPHPCKYCERTFYDKSHLLRHTRGEHTMERPFACDQCPKEFLTSHSLKCHLTTHSGVRAYPCKLCNTSYKTYSTRCEHYRSAMHKQNLVKQQTMSNSQPTDVSQE